MDGDTLRFIAAILAICGVAGIIDWIQKFLGEKFK
jgi:hypothetical protein